MRTKVEALSLATAIDIHADETARNICRAWALDSSISSAMSFYAEKIVLTDSEEDPDRNPNLLLLDRIRWQNLFLKIYHQGRPQHSSRLSTGKHCDAAILWRHTTTDQ